MLHLGALAFASPWMLLGLLGLPVIWWLVRISPPQPKRIRFPAIRLLAEIAHEEETPAHTPLWVLILRLTLAALIILGLARPLWNPEVQTAGSGPLLLVIDNGWTAAAHWRDREATLEGLFSQARRTSRPVMVAGTAAEAIAPELTLEAADEAASRAASLAPRAWQTDRPALLKRLQQNASLTGRNVQTIWLSDGLDQHDAAGFTQGLTKLAGSGGLTVMEPTPETAPLALLPPVTEGENLRIAVMRAASSLARSGKVRALAADGAVLAESEFTFAAMQDRVETNLALPFELRNRITRITIAGEESAGATALIDDSLHRRSLAIVSGSAFEESQPLLASGFYLQRALQPFAEIRSLPRPSTTSEIQALLARPLSVLILADVGTLTPTDKALLTKWVDKGGVLIRFAGPHLAGAVSANEDALIPVPLRLGGRALGGALSWTNPQRLAPFETGSPFFGLPVPDDVTITRQVLAEPSPDLQTHVWARLQDGTPLVTAANRGNGRVVLFHVTANSEWSNLPLSGLYVEMLRRVIALSRGEITADGAAITSAPISDAALARETLPALKTLDGFGRLTTPPPTATPIATSAFARTIPGPRHPAGFYGPVDGARALNATTQQTLLHPLATLEGPTARIPYAGNREIRLRPLALLLGALLILADGIAALWITGLFHTEKIRPRRFASRLFRILIVGAFLSAAVPHRLRAAEADDSFALKAALDTHLAYVLTGDAEVDDVSRLGLAGLSDVLRERSAFESAEPMGVDIARDELAFFPVLYWPMTPAQPALSPETLARIDSYLNNGGTIIFDTRDQGAGSITPGTGPGTQTLRRILERLDLPPLEQVPANHVLARSFYLLPDFPGRWVGGNLWIETPAIDNGVTARDGVSPIIIGSNDYAAAWARDSSGRALFPCVPGGEMQREMALRVGVNIVMYALTGNYKSDQVHVPALLERLGQ